MIIKLSFSLEFVKLKEQYFFDRWIVKKKKTVGKLAACTSCLLAKCLFEKRTKKFLFASRKNILLRLFWLVESF